MVHPAWLGGPRPRFGRLPWAGLLVLLWPSLINAQLPVSLRVQGTVGVTTQELVEFVDGEEEVRRAEAGQAIGVDLAVGVAGGLVVGVRYQRLVGSVQLRRSGVRFGFDANDLGGFAEYRNRVLLGSSLTPTYGIGASVSRLKLDDDVSLGPGSLLPAFSVRGETRAVRLYGLFTLTILVAELQLHVGRTWAALPAADLEYGFSGDEFPDPRDETITYDASYDGFFANLALAVKLF